ncbi:hypothetical protein ScPMuIL_005991 [Solemya velum]
MDISTEMNMALHQSTRMKLFQENEDSSPVPWTCLTPGKWDQGQVELTPIISNLGTKSMLFQGTDADNSPMPGINSIIGSLFSPRNNDDVTLSRKRKRGPVETRNKRFKRFWSLKQYILQENGNSSPFRDDIIYEDKETENDIPNPADIREDALTVKIAVNRLTHEDDLIADGSRTYTLPTIPGKHSDLKSITPETLSRLIGGEYSDTIGRYEILDCRYPYEYDGGHIQGASNVYTKDGILDLLSSSLSTSSEKRTVLVFHCEFSSERAPKLCRFLRNKDREMNKDSYPNLTYPEIYILHGGYSNFFNSQLALCEPRSYKPMLHKDHVDDVRHFRKKSKSWTSGEKQRRISKLSLRF